MNRKFIPKDETLLVLFLDDENIAEITEGITSSVLIYSGFDWNRDLSPWPAKAVFKSADFAGKADETIDAILRDQIFAEKWKCINACGYSMAGLFILYMSTRCSVFNGIASCSGSLWYDGFLSYLKDHPVQAERVYLSVGDRESHTRNERMKTVIDVTRKAADLLGKYTDVHFEMNPGTHFDGPAKRMNKGIQWLLKQDERN